MSEDEVIFEAWKYRISQELGEYGHRYLRKNRIELIELLASSFVENGITREIAMTYKNKIVDVLVTEKGRKATKKEHRTWVKNTLEDFTQVISNVYLEKKEQEGLELLSKDSYGLMKKWVDSKYDGNPSILNETKKYASYYWCKFITENFVARQ